MTLPTDYRYQYGTGCHSDSTWRHSEPVPICSIVGQIQLQPLQQNATGGNCGPNRGTLCTSLRTLAERRSGSGARAPMPSLSGNRAHLILLQAPAAASGRSSIRAGGWARGWLLGPVEPKLLKHMPTGATMSCPFRRGDAGLPRYCGLVAAVSNPFLYPSFLRACISHLTNPQLAPWSTSEGPFMQCKCQQQRGSKRGLTPAPLH